MQIAVQWRRAYLAMNNGDWESFKEECRKEGKLCECAFERLQEAYEKVAMDDISRLNIAQEILRKSADFLRQNIANLEERNSRRSRSRSCGAENCEPL